MKNKTAVIDITNCLSCSICVQTCPVSALSLTMPGKSGKYRNLFPELAGNSCIGCGNCVKECPMGCIRLENGNES